ncbi:hypothetical protein AwWohl_06530 [Gammaproteobacteria bacterium]|nr:hypothetical protein AwWohl_06530 [Gammaproteobacteria bacterium]
MNKKQKIKDIDTDILDTDNKQNKDESENNLDSESMQSELSEISESPEIIEPNNINHKPEKNTPITADKARSGSSFPIILALAAAGIAGYSYYESTTLKSELKAQIDQTQALSAEFKNTQVSLNNIVIKNADVKPLVTTDEFNALRSELNDLVIGSKADSDSKVQTLTNLINREIESLKSSSSKLSENLATSKQALEDFQADFNKDKDLIIVVQKTASDAIKRMSVLETQVKVEMMAQQQAYKDIENLTKQLNISTDMQALNLAEVHYLIRIAAHKFNFEKDVKSTITALTQALNRLNEVNEPRFIETSNRINIAIDALNALNIPDRQDISKKITDMASQIANAPLLADRAMDDIKAEFFNSREINHDPDKSIMRRFIDNVKPLVRVQHERIDIPALMETENAFFLRQNILLQLNAAQNSLLSEMPEIYLINLKIARDWIAKYYDPNDEQVALVIARLNELLDQKYNDQYDGLTAILKAFEASMLLRAGDR